MGFFARFRSRSSRWILIAALFVAVVPARPAWAVKNRTIILRATASGAALGLGAGLVSYPFAKSTGTILAGAVVGALLGTVYGYHLVNRRDEAYRSVSLEPERTPLADLREANARRDAVFRRSRPVGQEVAFAFSMLEF